MSPFRYRDDESSSTGTVLGILAGAVAGFAVGMYVAHRVGGIDGLTAKFRRRGVRHADETLRGAHAAHEEEEEFEDIEEDEFEIEDYDETLEERVLEAFRNDPILAERAVDIGSIGEGVIELAGWVEDDDESKHAVTIARGVPGVDTVVNRIAIGDEERRFEEAAQRVSDGDPSLTETRWEGGTVGTGRRRQGTSDEPDRHADPRVPLENHWTSADDAIRNAADDIEGTANRRARAKSVLRGDRASGGPVAPTGVPKGDHVANPLNVDRSAARVETSREPGSSRTEPTDRI
jgi:BON domain